ncbi:response regulator [Marinobacter sp. X15-166B]|uniref:response regulator n=1 Tax=Marinobacter sp. X15-166B TaxID=1897620 RepID=UPI00085C6584|nr:response regulator [Marinobacter sp. X15-166B]OEY66574.1 response regulator receiver protein [Marinobacter sp. X15-166B]
MIKIQLVDDEPNILKALKRLLKAQGWEVDAYDNVDDALGGLLAHDYAVIVSDYLMPAVDGVTYLQFAKQRRPDAMRLVLTAHGDRQSVIKAINQAEVYRYLTKPWNDYEIVAAIQSAVELHQLVRENHRLLQTVATQKAMLQAREQELQRLEAEHPGITQVLRDTEGSILVGDDS